MALLDSIMPLVVKTLLSTLGTTASLIRRPEGYDPLSGSTTPSTTPTTYTLRTAPPQQLKEKGVPVKDRVTVVTDAVMQSAAGVDVAFDPKFDPEGGQDVLTVNGEKLALVNAEPISSGASICAWTLTLRR